jgi:hypothetical protein
MRRRCSILAFCILLAFGVSLAVPAEDVPETAYDESEALPYEGTPLFSIVVPLVAARTTQAVPSSLLPELGTPSPSPSARVRDTNAKRPTDARTSLALLCTLLC